VLSAYLITLLLLKEQDQTGDIHLPQFYMRRILRIWPLYFFALAIAAALSYADGSLHSSRWWFLGALCLCANYVSAPALTMPHLWTISLEEQFYLFWPLVMKRLSRRFIAVAAIAIIVFSDVVIAYSTLRSLPGPTAFANSFVQFQMFAAGALLALVDAKLSPPGARRSAILVCLAAVFVYSSELVFHVRYDMQGHPVKGCIGYTMIAIACVLFIAGMPRSVNWPKWILNAGKISYGIYVFHFPIIFFCLRLHISRAITIPGSLVLTYICAQISYRYLESPFLRLKHSYELVKSRPT